MDSALDKIQALNGVYFNMIDTPERTEIGLIAQNVQKAFPDWVSESDGYKAVAFRGFEALTVESLR